MRITIKEAAELMSELADMPIFGDDYTSAFTDIYTCLKEMDELNLNTFGADDAELECLYCSPIDPYHSSQEFNTPETRARFEEHQRECERVLKKYSIRRVI